MKQGEATRGGATRGVGAGVLFGAVVLLSAGVVAPLSGGFDDEKHEEAERRAQRIGEALRRFAADCGDELMKGRAVIPERLYGPGVQPEMGSFADRPGFPLSGVLTRDQLGLGAAWKGPYLEHVPSDPWGRAYIANLGALTGDGDFFIASAGEDGVLQTSQHGRLARADVGATLLR